MRQVVEKECKKISNIRENLKLQFGRTCHAPLQTGSRVFGQRCLVRVNSISLWLFVQRIIIFSKGCHFDISTRFFCSPDLSPFSVPKSDLPTSYPVVAGSSPIGKWSYSELVIVRWHDRCCGARFDGRYRTELAAIGFFFA